jgi:hypothetical protein
MKLGLGPDTGVREEQLGLSNCLYQGVVHTIKPQLKEGSGFKNHLTNRHNREKIPQILACLQASQNNHTLSL